MNTTLLSELSYSELLKLRKYFRSRAAEFNRGMVGSEDPEYYKCKDIYQIIDGIILERAIFDSTNHLYTNPSN